jgi:hypothetical protein
MYCNAIALIADASIEGLAPQRPEFKKMELCKA